MPTHPGLGAIPIRTSLDVTGIRDARGRGLALLVGPPLTPGPIPHEWYERSLPYTLTVRGTLGVRSRVSETFAFCLNMFRPPIPALGFVGVGVTARPVLEEILRTGYSDTWFPGTVATHPHFVGQLGGTPVWISAAIGEEEVVFQSGAVWSELLPPAHKAIIWAVPTP